MATIHTVNAHGSYQQAVGTNKTTAIYSLIRDAKYDRAIELLSVELQNFPKSRAALSLLGHCYYYVQDFVAAAEMYEALVKLYPDVAEYRVYLAQSLYKAGEYASASKCAAQVQDPVYAYQMFYLQAAIKYEEDNIQAAKAVVGKCLPDDPTTIVAHGCILFKEGEFEAAKLKFQQAADSLGFQSDLAYNIAVCHFKLNEIGEALKLIGEIVDKAVRTHPELSVGTQTDGIDVRSVGNSQILQDTRLIEAFNLRAAIEYLMKNVFGAKEAISDMPPRNEEELDKITLHNQALVNMDTDPTSGFKKLTFLLSQPPFPPETFGNLLLLYIQYGYFDTAADVLADNVQFHQSCLSPELYEYLEAVIQSQSSPAEAFRKFELLSQKHIPLLRNLTQQIQLARTQRSDLLMSTTLDEYNKAIDRYIPVLMSEAKIYWDRAHYPMVEMLLKQAYEFCTEHDVWVLNLAHTFFMQEGKYREAIQYYVPFVEKKINDVLSLLFSPPLLSSSSPLLPVLLTPCQLLEIKPVVLANLCVAYIMMTQTADAEMMMQRLEKEEKELKEEGPSRQVFHSCIVNLVIGTLYCAKGNFVFGIDRIMRSLQPIDQKLSLDTWFYVKRCILALLDNLAKHIVAADDKFIADIIAFLTEVEVFGKNIVTLIASPTVEVNPLVHNVSNEARLLRGLFLKIKFS